MTLTPAQLADQPPAPDAPPPPREPAERSTRELWLEVGVILFVCVAPSLAISIELAGERMRVTVARDLYLTASGYAPLTVLLFYVIQRSGEPIARFGIVRPRWKSDLALAAGVWAVAYVDFFLMNMVYMGSRDVNVVRHVRGGLPPAVDVVLLVLLCCLIGLHEELLYRAYLVPRFQRLLGSTGKAVLATGTLFAAVHVYQGMYGVAASLVVGLVFGFTFSVFRRLWPLALAHGAMDFVAMV